MKVIQTSDERFRKEKKSLYLERMRLILIAIDAYNLLNSQTIDKPVDYQRVHRVMQKVRHKKYQLSKQDMFWLNLMWAKWTVK